MKKVLPAYSLTSKNLSLSFCDVPVPFLGFSDVSESTLGGGQYSEEVTQNISHVGHGGGRYSQEVTQDASDVSLGEGQYSEEVTQNTRNGPVVQGDWRRARWLKRRGSTTSCVGLGPSVGGALGNVGCGDDADVVADEEYGRCGGFLAPL